MMTISFEQISSKEIWEEEKETIGVGILEGELYADGELVGDRKEAVV